jgi:hypothetical protein
VLVNICKQCQKQWSGGALTIGLIGGREIVYFGGSRVHYTHLGYFGARGRAGGGCRAFIRSQTNQFFSQLGNRCQLALLGFGFATALVGLGFS